MFKLTDLIELSGVKLDDFKVHCATGIETSPLEAFLDGTWKEWQEKQNQRNFECKQVVSLIHLAGDRWLFAGVFKVLGVQHGNNHNPNGFMYSTEEIEGLGHLTGRAIVQFNKKFRASYLSPWVGDIALCGDGFTVLTRPLHPMSVAESACAKRCH